MQLLTKSNPKTQKGEVQGYQTYILHLAPADLSGHEVCPKRTQGCTQACLNTAGRGGMFTAAQGTNAIQEARKRKTRQFFEDREQFMLTLVSDIRAAIRQSRKQDLTPVFRLNGTSDLAWEKYTINGLTIFDIFPGIQFYDYTKVLGRKVAKYQNYHLTFSAADGNDRDVSKAIEQGMNVAVVFDRLPDSYKGRRVVDGDLSDLRFLDPDNVIVGLKAKGRARRDQSGFVIRLTAV